MGTIETKFRTFPLEILAGDENLEVELKESGVSPVQVKGSSKRNVFDSGVCACFLFVVWVGEIGYFQVQFRSGLLE